jgi:predicted transcriptional regulator
MRNEALSCARLRTLLILEKIEEGLEELDRGEGVPHDEVRRRLRL